MQISTKFTIAIHILAAVEYFGKDQKVTSDLLSSSIGASPIDIKRGPGGITLSRPLDEISFYDVYEAVEKSKDELFHFHENPNPKCPVGRNIHAALIGRLEEAQRNFENDLKRYKVSDVTADVHRLVAKEAG